MRELVLVAGTSGGDYGLRTTAGLPTWCALRNEMREKDIEAIGIWCDAKRLKASR